ncbi:troponin T, skeletal muscle-like isoform X1 [Littorina saxatilis]|uniref:Troponin T n=2 Tax=Littorina saxatilis TaxID=31220 RepID=A0AAN9G841_9CAEN
MADDEHAEGGEEETPAEETQESEPAPPPASEPAAPERAPQPDTDEGKRIMEERTRSKAERQKEELAEYEESRREEREKEAAEIAALREKRIQRAKERVEEEKKMAELRAQEDIRRRTEEEERRKKKTEEETRKKEERDQKKREAEDRLSKKGPNFVITKRSDAEKVGLDSVMSKEELQKSKEQLEEEKQAILSQRIQPLKLDGMDGTKLQEKAKELYEHMRRLVGDKYDLEQRFKRQQYDMIELAERARQMNKGKKKGATVMVDESFDRLADKFTSAPPKIQLCSKYERHTDHRTYVERKDLFKKLAEEPPPPEIQHVAGQGPQQEESAPAAAEEAAE